MGSGVVARDCPWPCQRWAGAVAQCPGYGVERLGPAGVDRRNRRFRAQRTAGQGPVEHAPAVARAANCGGGRLLFACALGVDRAGRMEWRKPHPAVDSVGQPFALACGGAARLGHTMEHLAIGWNTRSEKPATCRAMERWPLATQRHGAGRRTVHGLQYFAIEADRELSTGFTGWRIGHTAALHTGRCLAVARARTMAQRPPAIWR